MTISGFADGITLTLGPDTIVLTAASGNSFTALEIGYETSTGVIKTNANAESTASRGLVIASGTIAASGSGIFKKYDRITTSGLTEGIQYLDPSTTGGFTSTRPSGSGEIVRIVGYAISTTLFEFDPDHSWVELV